jgi:hypothetical protein
MDALGAAWIGVAGSVIGGFVGSLATWLFARSTAERDRLVALYGEWAVACHDVLIRARDMSVAISKQVEHEQGVDYATVARFYLNREPGNIYWREYVDFVRRLQIAQLKVETLGDDYDGRRFPEIVAMISAATLKIDIINYARDVRDLLRVLFQFTALEMPTRFGSRRWKRVVQIGKQFKTWLLSDFARELEPPEPRK